MDDPRPDETSSDSGTSRRGAAHPPVVRIAIIGGGCAGMAAAWELSKNNLRNDAKELFDITVYEASSMLGGKGSSYRDDQGRIHEHGLHIWLGFYENAFAMVREAYKEAESLGMGPNSLEDKRLPFRSFEDAFSPESRVGVASKTGEGTWEAWTGYLPPTKGLPGDPIDTTSNPFTLAAYLARCISLTLALMNSVINPAGIKPGEPRPDGRSASDEAQDLNFVDTDGTSPELLIDKMADWVEKGFLVTAAGILQGATLLETWLREFSPLPQFDSTVLKYVEVLATQVRRRLRKFVAAEPHVRRKTEIIDLIMTIVVGLYRDRVLFDQERGLDKIDDIDCKAWLIKHGALKTSVDSPFVTGLYDLAFCYRDGDRNQPALAAGQALRGALRMFFSYRGSIFWRLRAGMGETVFSPLYRVLASRTRSFNGQPAENRYPVKFEFMNRLETIEFDAADKRRPKLSKLVFAVATSHPTPLDHFGCWRPPQEWSTGHKSRQAICSPAGKDSFDGAIFALGIDDFRAVVQRSPPSPLTEGRWKLMFDKLATVGTQAAQAWLRADLSTLGWTRGPILMSGYERPFETWAEMTDTLSSERRWVKALGEAKKRRWARSVVYFCGVLSDADIREAASNANLPDGFPEAHERAGKELKAAVRKNLNTALSAGMKPFWPRAYDNRKSALKYLMGNIQNQHVQANWYGSARYTLALPGTSRFRISPLDRSVVNMTIAGDWTECSFNEGCVEAAVMSGMLAAHAVSVSRQPALEAIVGYDHP